MTHADCTCTVEVSPDEADAGTDITLKVSVACSRKDSLIRPEVSIRNRDDTELARATLKKSANQAWESDDIALAAPHSAGEHTWRAVVIASGKDGALRERASTAFRVVVKPHAAQLNVWDVPPTVVAGERFRFTVGVKCSAGCNLAGRGLSIIGHDGVEVCTASLSRDIWPETDALHFAEIEAEAPPGAGSYDWKVKSAEWDLELPHDAGALTFALRVVDPPDCEITVEVVDKDKQTPIKGARVVIHPYRATTDENGIAKLKVSKGEYDLLVSGSQRIPLGTTLAVTADLFTRAELDVDPPWAPPDETID